MKSRPTSGNDDVKLNFPVTTAGEGLEKSATQAVAAQNTPVPRTLGGERPQQQHTSEPTFVPIASRAEHPVPEKRVQPAGRRDVGQTPAPPRSSTPSTATSESGSTVSGGDAYNCLTATELDKLIQPRLSAHYISAYQLYNIRIGADGPNGPAKLAALIRERVASRGWVFAPFHVAHHWATAIFYGGRDRLRTRVYDSAPSPKTQSAFVRVIRSLGFDEPEIVSHGKQPRGSNECGVHVVWLAAMQDNDSPTPYLPQIQRAGHEMVVHLGALRHVIASALQRGMCKGTAKRMLELAPPPARADGAEPAGGAGPEADRPNRIRNPDDACYVIATMQALAHTIPAGRVSGSLETHLQAFRESQKAVVTLHDDLRATMQDPAKRVPLNKIGQHDAEEFLTRLIDSNASLASLLAVDETTITEKRHEADTRQHTRSTGIRLPVDPLTDSVEDAFDKLEEPAVISRTVTTRLSCTPAADFVFFQLKRFDNTGGKLAKAVQVPQRFEHGGFWYDVTAAVMHQGKTQVEGHYTACVKRAGAWWLVDDAKDPQRVSDPRQHLNRAYLVFARVTADDPSKKKKKAQRQEVVANRPPLEAVEPQAAAAAPEPALPAAALTVDEARLTHDRKPGNFMHTTTVDAYIAKLRTAPGARGVIFTTADAELAKLIHEADKNDAHSARRLSILKKHFTPDRDVAWIICADGHYIAVLRKVGQPRVEVLDSMPGKRPNLEAVVTAVAAVMALLDGKPKPYPVEQVLVPKQNMASNDCARHALRAAYTAGTLKDARLPTRDEIVDLILPVPLDDTAEAPPKSTVSRGKVVQFAYTVLQPGDRRRTRMRKGSQADNKVPMLVLRVDDDEGDTAQCPLCEDGSPHQFTKVGNYGAASAIEYHVKTQHGMCFRTIRLTPCPCRGQQGAATCGAMAVKAAVNQSHGPKAHVPHREATLCGVCNTWWGNKSPLMPFRFHPCIAPGAGRRSPPWPLSHENPDDDGAPVGVDTLTPSPPRAEETAHPSMPVFRTGEWRGRLPPLAETPVHSLTILADADPDLAKALVRKALAKETRMSHVRILRAVGEAAQHLVTTENPLANTQAVPWLIDWIKQRATEGRWKWSTVSAHMGVLQSAMNYVQTYVKDVAGAWHLWTDTNWKLAMRTARTKAMAERPMQALPATTEQVLRACKLATPEVAFVLAVTWITFGRSGALIQLRREDVELKDTANGDTTFTITIMRGKSNRLGQDPHSITGKLGDFSIYVKPIVNSITNPKQFIIHAPSSLHRDNIRKDMKSALRSANNEPRLENRSLRRGSLQTMAAAGATTQMLLACSGHSSVKSLKRYLNFGRVMTDEQKAVTKIYDSIVTGGSGGTALSC